LIYNESLRVWFISHYEAIHGSVQMHFKIVDILRKKNWDLLDKEIIDHNNVFRERIEGYFKNFLKNSFKGNYKLKIGTP